MTPFGEPDSHQCLQKRLNGHAPSPARRVLAHEIALQPGSAAIGRFGMVTALAVPGLPDQAYGLTLAVPALDRLCGRQPRNPVTRRLTRKVASSVGVAEITLLKEKTTACDWQLIA